MGNFDDLSRISNKQFFYYSQTNYDNDKLLYDLLQNEAFNKHGVPMDYYIVTYDTAYDKIFGEDNNRRVKRTFPVMVYYTLPTEDKNWTPAAMSVIDNFHIYISKRHFTCASQLNLAGQEALEGYTPQVGDFIKAKYNDFYYEITHVAQEEEMFLEAKHSWDLVLVQFKDQHIPVSATGEILVDPIATVPVTDKIADIFDIATYIDTNKGAILYDTSAAPETPPQDPFGGW